jgi:formylglycine-generating enzyme required for sulfatase activity
MIIIGEGYLPPQSPGYWRYSATLGLTILGLGLVGRAAGVACAEGGSPHSSVEAYAPIQGGEFHSVIRDSAAAASHVEPFALERMPVTNGEYLDCESRNARLPTWVEWEFAAAADEHVADARHDPTWRQTMISALSRCPDSPLPAVGLKSPNLYGIHDLHGLVWEWVEDFDALFTARGHSEREHAGMAMPPGDTAMSCGAAALSVSDPENYPMILRLAVRSSLNRNSTTADLGFRCARSISSPPAPRPASGTD